MPDYKTWFYLRGQKSQVGIKKLAKDDTKNYGG